MIASGSTSVSLFYSLLHHRHRTNLFRPDQRLLRVNNIRSLATAASPPLPSNSAPTARPRLDQLRRDSKALDEFLAAPDEIIAERGEIELIGLGKMRS